MGGYGQKTLGRIGSGITVSADGSPEAKTGGITIAWEGVTAATNKATYLYSDDVEVGEKFIRYGTVLCKVTGGASDGKYAPHGATVSGGSLAAAGRGNWVILNRSIHEYDYLSDHVEAIIGGRVYKERIVAATLGVSNVYTLALGGATGGDFTISVNGELTEEIAYNASNADYIEALQALSVVDGAVTVTGTTTKTITFYGSLVNGVSVSVDDNTSGGTGLVLTNTPTSAGPSVSDLETSFPTLTYVTEKNI